MAKKEELYNDDLQAAIIYIPKDVVQLNIIAHLLDPDTLEVYEAENKMTLSDIKEAVIAGDEWEAENITYRLNPDYLKELEDGKTDT